jgi:hypothetical protein
MRHPGWQKLLFDKLAMVRVKIRTLDKTTKNIFRGVLFAVYSYVIKCLFQVQAALVITLFQN